MRIDLDQKKWELLLKDIPDKPLREQDVDAQIAQAQLDLPRKEVEGLAFSLEAGASLTLKSFNSPDDKDEAGVVGPEPRPDTPLSTNLRPQLHLRGDRAWMKYQYAAKVKASAGTRLDFLAPTAEGEASVLLSDYRAHALDARARAAAQEDLSRPRFAIQKESLLTLGEGDAVAYQLRCHLRTALELNWADLLTANLNGLSLLRGGEFFGIKASLSASVMAAATLTDDFILIFSRPQSAARQLRVAVRKGRSRVTALGGELGIRVEIQNPAALEAQLSRILEGLVGAPVEKVDAILKEVNFAVLTDEQKALLQQLLERLDLSAHWGDLASFKQAWGQYTFQVRSALQKTVESRIAAGFRYDYLRLPESATLLEVILPEERAMELHGSLLRGDLTPALQWMKDSGHKPELYLHQDSLLRQQAWGFSLGLGQKELLRSRDEERLERVLQKNLDGEQRIAFLGVRGYEGKLLGNSLKWTIDFKADTSHFLQAPAVSDFTYGLHFLLRREEKKLSREELRTAIDEAIVWRALDDADDLLVLRELEGHLDKEPIETRLELKFDHEAYRALLAQARELDPKLFARALARAMPWSPERPRSAAEVRRIIYAPIWEAYFEAVRHRMSAFTSDLPPQEAARLAFSLLRSHPIGRELRLREMTFQQGGEFSFAEITDKNRGTFTRWQSFASGLERLRRGMDERGGLDTLEATFRDFRELWKTYFHVKAAGALLLELAWATPQRLSGVERTFTVRLPGRGQQLIFSTSRGAA